MGIFSSLKRLFFVKESIAKSAAEKSVDYVKDKGNEMLDSGKDFVTDTGETILEKTSGLRESLSEQTEEWADKGKDIASDISDKAEDLLDKTKDFAEGAKEKVAETMDKLSETEVVKKAADLSEEVGSKVLDAGESVMEKAKDISEKVGSTVLDAGEAFMDKAKEAADSISTKLSDEGGDITEKAKEASENLGSAILDAKDDMVERAKEIVGDLNEKLDDTIAKAEKMAEEEALKPKKEFSDETLDTSGSLLEDSNDFFSKAAQYADGDYHAFEEGKTTIISTPQDVPVKKSTPAKAAGFEDLDGDGNEIIDDAIISEEE